MRVIAGLTGIETPRASALDVTIESPEDGATIDLAEVGGTIDLAGTVAVTGGDLAAIEVTERGTVLGSPDVRYGTDGISWVFRTAAPESGTYEFTVAATDRSGARASSSVRVTIELPAKDKTVIIDEVQILDDPSTIAVTALSDDTIVVICALEVGPGDYIVAGSIPGAPNGFLRRIIAVDVTDEGTVLHTEPAALTDVILQASADEEAVLGEGGGTIIEEQGAEDGWEAVETDAPAAWMSETSFADAEFTELTEVDETDAGTAGGDAGGLSVQPASLRNTSMAAGIARPGARAAASAPQVEITASSSLKIGLPLERDLGSPTHSTSSSGKVKTERKAEGGFYIEAATSASLTLGISADVWVTWSWGIPTPHLDLTTSLETKAKNTTTVAAYLKGAVSRKSSAFDKKVAKYHFPGITVYLGIPVWVKPSASLSLVGEVSATASVEYTVERSITKKITVDCNDGRCRATDEKPKGADGSTDLNAEKSTFTGGGTIEAEVGPELSASALLYGAAGPEFALSAKLGAAAKIEGSTDEAWVSASFEIYAKAKAGLSLVVEIPAFEIRILEWEFAAVERKFTLARFESPKKPLSDPPPGGGSTGGGSASGSSGTKPTPGSGGGTGTTRDAIDVMFVIDTTGSMSGIISATLQKARDIAARLSSTARSARIGLVEFRDYGDDFMARTVQPLTEDLSTFGAGLDTLYADGGGDWEEAVYSGIVTALAEDWRPSAARTIIVMGDAPAHDPEYHTGYTGSQVAGFLSGATPLCQNGDTGIIGGPVLPTCVGGASFRTAPDSTITTASFSTASFSTTSSVAAARAPMERVTAGLPVMLFGVSSDDTLTSQLAPLAEATGGTVADICGSDAVGDAIDEALASAGAAPQPYFEWAPDTDDGTIAFDASGSLYEGETATFTFAFGDGSASVTGTDPVATHTFAAPGVYTVTLTVTDADGRTTSVEAAVEIAPDEPAWSAFTATATPDAVRPGESVTIEAAGLTPGERVTVAWDGISGVASGVVGADGTLQVTLPVPIAQAAGELGFTARAVDSRRIASGSITVTPLLVVCS